MDQNRKGLFPVHMMVNFQDKLDSRNLVIVLFVSLAGDDVP